MSTVSFSTSDWLQINQYQLLPWLQTEENMANIDPNQSPTSVSNVGNTIQITATFANLLSPEVALDLAFSSKKRYHDNFSRDQKSDARSTPISSSNGSISRMPMQEAS